VTYPLLGPCTRQVHVNWHKNNTVHREVRIYQMKMKA